MASIRIMMRGEMSGTLLLMEADGGITYPRQGTEQWDVILFFADGSWARCPCRNRDLRQVRAAALAVKDRFLSMGTVSGFFNWRTAHERFFRTKTEIRAEQAAQNPQKTESPKETEIQQAEPPKQNPASAAEKATMQEKRKSVSKPAQMRCPIGDRVCYAGKECCKWNDIEWRRVDFACGGHYLIGKDAEGKQFVAVKGEFGAAAPPWLGEGGVYQNGYWIYTDS
ncbi:MAG: hypothetical protein DBX46_02270 [Clostridiales bacterium]|nr:MAG: hypothetical protein DBX46_02270 [Clostridiales bacterium]